MDDATGHTDGGAAVRHRTSAPASAPGQLSSGGWGSYTAERPVRRKADFLGVASSITPAVRQLAAPHAKKPAAALTVLALVVVAALQVAWVAFLLALFVRIAYA